MRRRRISAPAPHVACHGKGRKQRITPLTRSTVQVLRDWLREREGGPCDPLFPTSRGHPFSRDAVERRLTIHTHIAAASCPTLDAKKVTPHVLRHTAAMRLLQAGVDTSVIALWLGHESVETTQIYLHADLAIKERALARTRPPNSSPGRYTADRHAARVPRSALIIQTENRRPPSTATALPAKLHITQQFR